MAYSVCINFIIHTHQNYALSLTGTAFHLLLMDRSIPDDWSYNRVMLQLLGTTGTAIYTNYLLVDYNMYAESESNGQH